MTDILVNERPAVFETVTWKREKFEAHEYFRPEMLASGGRSQLQREAMCACLNGKLALSALAESDLSGEAKMRVFLALRDRMTARFVALGVPADVISPLSAWLEAERTARI